MTYKFNLTDLEEKALNSYSLWKEDNSEETRTKLFLGIKNLAFAILSVGRWKKENIDHDLAAYEYGVYLLTRILNGFKLESPEGRKFALQAYMRLNLNHVVFTNLDDLVNDVIGDIEYVLKKSGDVLDSLISEEVTLDSKLDEFFLSKKVYKSLGIFYSTEEVDRLLPLSLDIYFNNQEFYNTKAPKEIIEFLKVLIALAKRIVRTFGVDKKVDLPKESVKNILSSTIKSSVFLAAVVNSDFFSKELLLALDIDSLYRLIDLQGGKTIRIPTQRELDTLVGTILSSSKVILEGKDLTSSIAESKKDLDLVFTRRVHLKKFVSQAIDVYNLIGKDETSDPLINMVTISIKTLDSLLGKVVNDMESKEIILDQYVELSKLINTFTKSLIEINNSQKIKKL